MNATQSKQRTITLTGRRPVTIDESEWPLIARASDDDYTGLDPAKHEQASRECQVDEYSLRVRQHADGRAVVYGTYTESILGSDHDGLDHAGECLNAEVTRSQDRAIEAAIERVGQTLGVPPYLIAACIADLPAEKL